MRKLSALTKNVVFASALDYLDKFTSFRARRLVRVLNER